MVGENFSGTTFVKKNPKNPEASHTIPILKYGNGMGVVLEMVVLQFPEISVLKKRSNDPS